MDAVDIERQREYEGYDGRPAPRVLPKRFGKPVADDFIAPSQLLKDDLGLVAQLCKQFLTYL